MTIATLPRIAATALLLGLFPLSGSAQEAKNTASEAAKVQPLPSALLAKAREGDADAANQVGVLLSRRGDAKSVQQASEWWYRAAMADHADAQFNLGLYHSGKGGAASADIEKTLNLWEVAAAKSHKKALYNLGLLYYHGLGVPADKKKAGGYWTLAADLKDLKAMYNLGLLYLEGQDVVYHAGDILYYNGWGLDADHNKAIGLWREAASLGHEQSRESLTKLLGEGWETNSNARPKSSSSMGKPKTAAAIDASMYRVQLGAFADKDGAASAWTKASGANADLLGSLNAEIMSVDMGSGAVQHRLATGRFETKEEAMALCDALKQRQQDCFVTRP